MKYTDRFFKFPIKVYDGLEIAKAIMKEDAELQNNPEEAEIHKASWIQCWQKMLPDEIVGYGENFSRDVDDIFTEKPDVTVVEFRDRESAMCLWNIKEFEQKLNEFYERMNNNSINSEEKK